MGFFSKIFKGIKKVVKKIGKGIKKVVKKVGAAVGKLGIVGQIGMMFLMPYAMGALGSFFGQFSSAVAVGGKAASWANTLVNSANIGARALGHTMNAIHTVGTAVIKPFTFIRDQIGEAVNWIGKKTNTANLTDGVNKLIGYDPETRLKEFDLEAIRSKYKSIPTAGSAAESTFVGPLRPDAITGEAFTPTEPASLLSRPEVDVLDFSAPKDFSLTEAPKIDLVPSFKDQTRIKFQDMTKDILNLNPVEKQGWFAKQGESLVNAVKDFSVGEVVSSGIKRGGSERLAYAVAGDPPQQRILQTVRREADLLGLSNQFSDSTVFRSVNLASERQGNVWAGTNALNYDYIKSIGNDGTADYYNNMRGLELMA